MKIVQTPNNEYGVIIPDGQHGDVKLKVRMLDYNAAFKKDKNGEYIHQYWYAYFLNYDVLVFK